MFNAFAKHFHSIASSPHDEAAFAQVHSKSFRVEGVEWVKLSNFPFEKRRDFGANKQKRL